MNRIARMLAAVGLAAGAVACVTRDPFRRVDQPAVLEFPAEAGPGVVPGAFYAVDGRASPGPDLRRLVLAPGRHRVEYRCDGLILVDTLPTLQMNAAPGGRYAIVCGAGGVGHAERAR